MLQQSRGRIPEFQLQGVLWQTDLLQATEAQTASLFTWLRV